MKKIKITTFLFVFLLLIPSLNLLIDFSITNPTTAGNTLYVGPLELYTTIQSAVDAANPGDTIIVANDTYLEAVNINTDNLTLIGNSTTDCIVKHHYDGSSWLSDFAAAFNISAKNVTIRGFNISVSGQYNYGIFLNNSSSEIRIIDNNITTSGNHGYAILVNQSSNNNISGNRIRTTNTSGHGVLLYSSNNSYLNNNIIKTNNSDAIGISILESNETFITNCDINSTGQNSNGIQFKGKTSPIYTTTITNTTINSSNGSDINLTKDVLLTAINCSFNIVEVEQDGGGILVDKNYLGIQVFNENLLTPLKGADVEITDNSKTIYATPGYGGSYSRTKDNGIIENLITTHRWYYYNNTPSENITNLSVKKTVDRTWEETRNNIDMSISHMETFISSDITKPSVPQNIIIRRIPGINSLNVSWDLNPTDTVKYEVWAIKACFWTVIDNVTHPKNWTIDENLIDNKDHFYRIRAWDSVGLSSDYAIEQYNLSDITPPITPTNFNVRPVPNEDGLNLSWNLSVDDTKNYEVWWKEPKTGNWTILFNVSQPNQYYLWSNEKLINGSLYTFKIRAWDKVSFFSNFTLPVSVVHRDYLAPDTPKSLKAKTISDQQINLKWKASPNPDVDGYLVYINKPGTPSGGPYTLNGFSTNLGFNVTNLVENTRYYFVVKAMDEANNTSPFTKEVTNTTIGIPPEIPLLDEIPAYTNKIEFNVTGTSEIGSKIFIIVNNESTYTDITDETGRFKIVIDLKKGKNEFIIRARDTAFVYGNYSEPYEIILDTQKPTVGIVDNIELEQGQYVLFNASNSTDNYGISEYRWEFFYDGEIRTIFGRIATFQFGEVGDYEINLTVTDHAGNYKKEKLRVIVNAPPKPRPKITDTKPAPDSTGVSIKKQISISFDLAMSKETVQLEIFPKAIFESSWRSDDKRLFLDFKINLIYNTTYTITISSGLATNGESLKNAPYEFSFTTEEKPITPIITITYPKANMKFKPGVTITIKGSSNYVASGTEINVTILENNFSSYIDDDGKWSVDIEIPSSEGEHSITISIGDINTSITILVEQPDKGKDDEDKTKGIFGLGPMVDILILLVIIIIIIVIFLIAKKSRIEEPEDDLEYEEE